MRETEVRRIVRGTSHLERAIDAIHPRTCERNYLHCLCAQICHASISSRLARARTIVRLASSTLNALSRDGVAPARAASAAARFASALAGDPRKLASPR